MPRVRLTIVTKYHPGVTKIVDAKKPAKFVVTAEGLAILNQGKG